MEKAENGIKINRSNQQKKQICTCITFFFLISKKTDLHVHHVFFFLLAKKTNLHVQHAFYLSVPQNKEIIEFAFLIQSCNRHAIRAKVNQQRDANVCRVLYEGRKIIEVIYATFAVAKRKPEKNSGLYGIRTFHLKMSNHGSKIISK